MIDLFAGTGAFTLAFEDYDCVFANDNNKSSKLIYDLNNNHPLTLADINSIDPCSIPAFDLLTAGFPCQPFSMAGEKKGFEDKRANVFWKIMDFVDYHKPETIVLENVKNLIGHDEGNTFQVILTELINRNYKVSWKVLDTSKLTGIPQKRERIYIIADKNREIDLTFPVIPKKPITDFLETNIEEQFYYSSKSKIWEWLKQNITKPNVIYQNRRGLFRENKSNNCPTLTANCGTGGNSVPMLFEGEERIRKLTPRELFNFQGFPSTYKLPKTGNSNLYKLAGNAVSLPVVKLIAERIKNNPLQEE